MGIKTDNKSLQSKVRLRRTVLAAAGIDSARVLDLCAGEGHIWAAMKKHVAVETYTPCDRERRQPGTVIGEAVRLVQAFDLSQFNVIDIDTYGEPWEIFSLAIDRMSCTTAVFLTQGIRGDTSMSRFLFEFARWPENWWTDVPKKCAIVRALSDAALRRLALRANARRAWMTLIESGSSQTYYFGLICCPKAIQ